MVLGHLCATALMSTAAVLPFFKRPGINSSLLETGTHHPALSKRPYSAPSLTGRSWHRLTLVTLNFEIDAAIRIYRQPCPSLPMPRTPDIDFRPWSAYTSQATAIQLYDIEPNKEAQSLADWVSITEQYLLQEHPWQPQGRGYWVIPAARQTTCRTTVAQRQTCVLGTAQGQTPIGPASTTQPQPAHQRIPEGSA